GAQPLLQFARVTDAQIRECRAPEGTAVFLKVIGGEELKSQVVLADNELSKARQAVVFAPPGDGADSPVFTESAPGVFVIACERMKLFPPMVAAREQAGGARKFIEVPDGEGPERGRGVCRIEVKQPGEYAAFVQALSLTGEDDSFYF
ncbi:MAG: hypothetical protein Q7U75_09075, partial [Desulfobacterales bacterium]|nr:hypothetical protein [Desulfobacterales bacterium]